MTTIEDIARITGSIWQADGYEAAHEYLSAHHSAQFTRSGGEYGVAAAGLYVRAAGTARLALRRWIALALDAAAGFHPTPTADPEPTGTKHVVRQNFAWRAAQSPARDGGLLIEPDHD